MTKKITAITEQLHNRARVNLFLDGDYAFSVDRMAASGLEVGQQLNDSELSRLQSDNSLLELYRRACNYLTLRDRSLAEMERYLLKTGKSPEECAAVLERLQSEGLLNNSRYARDWIENRSYFRPRGALLLQRELHQKGLSREEIDRALSESGLDEELLAKRCAQKSARRYLPLGKETFLQKGQGVLLRRGFSYSLARQALLEMWNECNGEKVLI